MADPRFTVESDVQDVRDLNDILAIRRMLQGSSSRQQIHTSVYTGIEWVEDILNGHQERCQRNFRMKRLCFLTLCERLENYGLQPTSEVTTKEMLAIFLYIIASGLPMRQVAERFQRSQSTISVYFNIVLEVVLLLSRDIIRPDDPQFNAVPDQIRNSNRYYPYFRNCIGAIDGTHVDAHLAPDKIQPFIGRKGYATPYYGRMLI